MLRITAKKGGRSAEYYLKDDLGQPAHGEWLGKLSHIMGLHGEVDHQAFRELCENYIPGTADYDRRGRMTGGEKLTQRTKEDRIALYDYTFLMSKSATLVGELTGDERIFEAGRQALSETAAIIEQDMKTRARRFGLMGDRDTGNMVAAVWEHRMGRPVEEDGKSDPLRHYHLTVANATLDVKEGKVKASKQHAMMKSNEYYASVFHNLHAKKLNDLGYETKQKGKYFSVVGVPDSLVGKFSRRKEEAELYAMENGLTGKAASQSAARMRGRKRDDVTMPELSDYWAKKVTPSEWDSLRKVRERAEERAVEPEKPEHKEKFAATLAARESVRQAWGELTAKRKPEVPERKLAAAAMQKAYGKAKPGDVLKAIDTSGLKRTERKGVAYLGRRTAGLARRVAAKVKDWRRRAMHERVRAERRAVEVPGYQERQRQERHRRQGLAQ